MKANLSSEVLTQDPIKLQVKNILLLNPGGDEMMMRGLIRERPRKFGFCWPSVDMIITSGLLNARGYHLEYLDAGIDGLSVEKVIDYIGSHQIDAVVSLFSLYCKDNDVKYLKRIKDECPGIVLAILPDLHYILNPDRAAHFLDEQDWLDVIALSLTSHDLHKFFAGDFSDNLVNLCYRVDGKARLGKKDVVSENDYRLPVPRHDLFKNNKYFLPMSRNVGVTTTMMQFGCPYQCDFCIDKEAYKKSWCRSPENMVEEFEYIAAQGLKEVYLRDLTFGLNRPRALKFCELLIEKQLPIRWICTSRVDTVDEELLTLMKKAGCICVEFGVESGIDQTKVNHKKDTTNQEIVKTFRVCQKLGIETNMFVILGFPDETLDDIKRSIQFCFDLKGDFMALNVASALPGTEMSGLPAAAQNSNAEDEQTWQNITFDSINFEHPNVSAEEIRSLFHKTLKQFYLRPSFIAGRLTKIRSPKAFLRIAQIGLSVIQEILLKRRR